MLADAISLTGMSAQTFASHVLVRDPRTVRHWLAGSKPMPDVVANRLAGIAQNALAGRAWWVLAGAIGTLPGL